MNIYGISKDIFIPYEAERYAEGDTGLILQADMQKHVPTGLHRCRDALLGVRFVITYFLTNTGLSLIRD